MVSGILIFALLQTTRTADLLSGLSRPAVMAVSGLFGGQISDQGDVLMVGKLHVPWSRDCAGFDVLLVLWGLILWTSRHEQLAWRFWLRMAAAVPAAVVANILRVFTIIAWRQWFYPSVESPQAHYFIGFVWLLPLLFLFIPRQGKPLAPWLLVMAMPAAVLSLAAPQASAPGGMWVSAAAIVLLAVQHFHKPEVLWEKVLSWLWILAAVALAGASMESLWLPWLLACPWYIPRSPWLRACAVLLPATVPLFAMAVPWVCAGLLLVAAVMMVCFHARAHEGGSEEHLPGGFVACLLGGLFLVPFVASTLGPALREEVLPPRGMMARPLEADCWELKLPFHSPRVDLAWITPSGSGRHHTLPVCMGYRGRQLHLVKDQRDVFHDDEYWFAEVFLMPDGELCDYAGYLRRTLIPFSKPGVHLIASAPMVAMESRQFSGVARHCFEQVAAHYRSSPHANPP